MVGPENYKHLVEAVQMRRFSNYKYSYLQLFKDS